MGSRGAYAGQPYSFRCAKCKQRRKLPRVTGKTRAQRSEGMNYHNWGDVAYQYECPECGHIGWTRHPDVERVFKLSQKE